jgi:RNA polymerase sigma-70 factor (ECF subfamily)
MMTADELVDRYYGKIYKLCLFYLRDEQEAEEILHEIFIKVLKKQDTFKGEAGIYTWIYRLAVNTVLNYIRRKKIVEFISFESSSPPKESAAAESVEAEHEHREKMETLERCSRLLSSRERTAFYLYYYDGLKQKEIASVMKTSLSAIESLIHKAMKKIKQCAGEG